MKRFGCKTQEERERGELACTDTIHKHIRFETQREKEKTKRRRKTEKTTSKNTKRNTN